MVGKERKTRPGEPGQGLERLQKILSRAGVASRRKAEELIRQGRVSVNGTAAGLGDRAHPQRDAIKIDGKRLKLPSSHRYLLLNKPRGVVSSRSDPEGRSTVLDLVPPGQRRGLFPVGRLDYHTEGLLLLTTDGELAQHIAHPRYGCTKTYEVKVKGKPEAALLERLRGGIVLRGKKTAPCSVKPHRPSGSGRGRGENSWWIVRLAEGRSRQIREMFQRVGHPVQRLRRVAIGPLRDRRLAPGTCRPLTDRELELLRASVSRRPKAFPGKASRTKAVGRKPVAGRRRDSRPKASASPLVVAIDGPAGVGKSTAARLLARRLGIPYLDTGAMYRALGCEVLARGVDPADPGAVEELLAGMELRLEPHGGELEVLVDGEAVGDRIRSPEVGAVTSRISTYPEVRKRLVAFQRQCAQRSGGVLEGRDIGTVVYPETPHKFFFEAPLEVRIERRHRELVARGSDPGRDEVAREMEERDARDRSRRDSPLTKDPSYIVVDTSGMPVEGVVEEMVRHMGKGGNGS